MPVYTIKDGAQLEGTGVKFMVTQGKDSGPYADGLPDTIIIHFTAGRDLDSAVATLRDPGVKASAHLVVGRDDGMVRQLISFNRIAWHAGESRYGTRTNINRYAIGIEIDNAGRLEKTGNRYKAWFGRFYEEKDVFAGVHRNETKESYWHAYTESQIDVVFSICRALRDTFDIKYILGHEEIAPQRKIDPGPAFPLEELRNILFEDRSEMNAFAVAAPGVPRQTLALPQKGLVDVDKLNFRSLPATDGALIGDPLEKGQVLEILEERNGWYKVKVPKTGWVKREFVKKE
jgi:N-acetylmuramoyl-L-alanine amidase